MGYGCGSLIIKRWSPPTVERRCTTIPCQTRCTAQQSPRREAECRWRSGPTHRASLGTTVTPPLRRSWCGPWCVTMTWRWRRVERQRWRRSAAWSPSCPAASCAPWRAASSRQSARTYVHRRRTRTVSRPCVCARAWSGGHFARMSVHRLCTGRASGPCECGCAA